MQIDDRTLSIHRKPVPSSRLPARLESQASNTPPNSEESPSAPQAKINVTTPSRRFLASTKSSSAKQATPRTRAPLSPRSQPSRLPQRAQPPKTAPPTRKRTIAFARSETTLAVFNMDGSSPAEGLPSSGSVATATNLIPAKITTLTDAVQQPLVQEDLPTSTLHPSVATHTDTRTDAKSPPMSPAIDTSVSAVPADKTKNMSRKSSSATRPGSIRSSASFLDDDDSPVKASFETAHSIPSTRSSHDLPALYKSQRLAQHPHANFSRITPINFSRTTPSPTMEQRPATADSAQAVRSERTASRIPLPDAKKATLVDVKGRRTPFTMTGRSPHAQSFGSRRTGSADALKFIDQSTKRRQQSQSQHSAEDDRGSLPSRQPSQLSQLPRLSTSRESSTDEEEVTTPTEVPMGTFNQKNASRLFDGAVSARGRTPPSSSPWTDPLQSIPSQTVLSFGPKDPYASQLDRDRYNAESMTSNIHDDVLSTPEKSALAQDSTMTTLDDNDRISMMDFLNEYAIDERQDEETREHVKETLSALEGRSQPAETQVTTEQLFAMFGHLKRGMGRQVNSETLADKAVMADRYLTAAETAAQKSAAHTSEAEQYLAIANVAATKMSESPEEVAKPVREDVSIESPTIPPHHSLSLSDPSARQTAASKWSSSSTSVRDFADGMTSGKSPHLQPLDMNPPSHRQRPTKAVPPRSIGYPSRIAGPIARSQGSMGLAARSSSPPNIGIAGPGSVRAARETMHNRYDGDKSGAGGGSTVGSKTYPRPMSMKKPSVGKTDAISRGRPTAAAKADDELSQALAAKKPRGRSKSRYVLDKLNTLFANKRDTKRSSTPPVPAIPARNKARQISRARAPEIATVTPNGSPVSKVSRIPSIPHLPRMSPSIHPALRQADTTVEDIAPISPKEDTHADEDLVVVQDAAESLRTRAKHETQLSRKERLLTMAKILNDSMIYAREAQISAETAQEAARRAQMSYEMTRRGITTLRRLL